MDFVISMRQHKIYLTIVFLCAMYAIYANEKKNTFIKDSVKLNEVIVTGSRPTVNLNNLPMSVTVVGAEQIKNSFNPSILPLLTEEVPGLFVTSRSILGYGVSTGAAGGMSMRGVGGSPTTQLLVLIDGHPQYMGLMGHPLADAYQSLMTERVEVVRGPASFLYGSNAMGGVVNIITKKQKQDGVQTNARLLYGSYQTFGGEVGNTVQAGKFSSIASFGYNRSDGHRENMDFEQYSGYVKGRYELSSHWNAFADLNLTNFKASNPGPITALLIDNDADITRGVTSLSLENNYSQTSGGMKFFYNFGSHKINDGYAAGSSPLDSRFRSNDRMLGLSLYQTYRLFQGNMTTVGFDYQHMGGHAWNTYISKSPNTDIAKKSLNEVAGYVNFQQNISRKVLFNGGIRADHHSVTGTEWIPQIGLSFLAADQTVVKGIVSKGFRNPTIREMYMFPPQNPNLKPERLMNYELSASQGLINHTLHLDLSVYYIKGDNSIQTVMVEGKPLNSNTGKIENYGLEISTRYQLSPHLSLSANYSWLHMEYKVIASPEHKLYANVNYTRDKWHVSSGVQYIHNLYTSVQTGSEQKENFTLWNVRAAYQPISLLELFVRGENLLAQRYEINKGYPMPRATVFGGINLKF